MVRRDDIPENSTCDVTYGTNYFDKKEYQEEYFESREEERWRKEEERNASKNYPYNIPLRNFTRSVFTRVKRFKQKMR